MTDAEAALDRADMTRLQDGEEGALDALMHRHAGRLHGYLVRLLQNQADAEDLAQEAFARVYEHRARFDPRHLFTTWLYTIAMNLVRDRYRWRSRHPESSLDEEPGPAAVAPPTVRPDRSAPPNPADQALAVERSVAVRQAVAGLPEELRAPLILAEFEERNHAEIAAMLGCTAKAVEMRLYRARQELRRQLTRWLAT